jgi:prevent-host-death family protein
MWSHSGFGQQKEIRMTERRIGIRELKSRLSEYVREVKAGGTLVITERGRPVARLIPDMTSLGDRLQALRQSGAILWSGRRFRPCKPVARLRGDQTISDIVIENRE